MCGDSCGGGQSNPQFFQTKIGRKFIEEDIPEISRQLKIANLLKIAELTGENYEKWELMEKARDLIKAEDV